MLNFLDEFRRYRWIPKKIRIYWRLRRLFLPDTLALNTALSLIVLFMFVPLVAKGYQLFQLSNACSIAVGIVGLNLLSGYNGQLSLGHGAFFGIGAFVQVILMTKYSMHYLPTLLLSGLISFIIGILFGIPALRLEKVSLAIATFALAVATPQIFERFDKITGGSTGISILQPDPPKFFQDIGIGKDQLIYYFSFTSLLIFMILITNIINSDAGRAIRAIRDNDIASESLGISNNYFRVLCFGISAFITGFGGGLFALVNAHAAPDDFNVNLSVSFLSGMVLGGMGSSFGPIYGAMFIQFVPPFIERYSKTFVPAAYGIALIFFMFFDDRGIAGLIKKVRVNLNQFFSYFKF